MRNIVFTLSTAILLGITFQQSFQPVKPAENLLPYTPPLFSASQANTDLTTIITSVTNSANFASDFNTDLFNILSSVLTTVINRAIQDWKDVVSTNSIITNYASQINTFQARYQQRYQSINQTVSSRLSNPNLLGIINGNNQTISTTLQYLGNIANVSNVSNAIMGVLNNQAIGFRNVSQANLDQIVQLKNAIGTQVIADNTNVTAFFNGVLQATQLDLNSQLQRINTLVTALKTWMVSYIPANSGVFFDALTADRNYDLTVLRDALAANVTAFGAIIAALDSNHAASAYADISTQIDGINANLTAFIAPVLTPTVASAPTFDTLIASTKGLWNSANNLLVYLNYVTQAVAKRPQLEQYLVNAYTDDLSNTLANQFFLNSQYDEIYEQASSLIKSINRLNTAMNTAGTGYGSLDVVFYTKNWAITSLPAASSIPSFVQSSATIYSYALPTIAYSATVTPKIINCAIIDPTLSFVMAYDWAVDTSVTPSAFRLYVAVNDALAASGNVRCTVIYDLITGGLLSSTLPSKNGDYGNLLNAPNIFA